MCVAALALRRCGGVTVLSPPSQWPVLSCFVPPVRAFSTKHDEPSSASAAPSTAAHVAKEESNPLVRLVNDTIVRYPVESAVTFVATDIISVMGCYGFIKAIGACPAVASPYSAFLVVRTRPC